MNLMNRAKPNKLHGPALGILALALAVMAVALVFLFLRQEMQVKVDGAVYQYHMGQRLDYPADTHLMLGRYNVIIQEENERSDGDESPIYLSDRKELILPGDMSWTDPVSGIEWQIPALSTLSVDGSGAVWCTVEKKKVLLGGGFLSDTKGTYVFLDEMHLRVNGSVYTLSPLSFYSAAYDTVEIYDYDSAELTEIAKLAENAVATGGQGYQVDLTAAIYTDSAGVQRLLAAAPAALTSIRKK